MRRCKLTNTPIARIVLAAAGVSLAAAMAVTPAEARMSKAQVKQALEKAYPVRVLDKYTKLDTADGRAVYRVKVMNRGGDFNAAFMITTLVVDADSGKLPIVFRHKTSGYDLGAGGGRAADRQPADSPRGVHWR